jgi:hypothetical protein
MVGSKGTDGLVAVVVVLVGLSMGDPVRLLPHSTGRQRPS